MDDTDFDKWLNVLNIFTEVSIGLSIYDLNDHDFLSMYEGGLTAKEALKTILEGEGLTGLI